MLRAPSRLLARRRAAPLLHRAGSSASVPSDARVSRSKSLPVVSLDDTRGASGDALAQAFEEFGCCYLTSACALS